MALFNFVWLLITLHFPLAGAGFASLPITRTTFGLYFRASHAPRRGQGLHNQLLLPSQPLHLLTQSLKQHKIKTESGEHNTLWDSSVQKGFNKDDDLLYAWFWSTYTTPVGIGNPLLSLKATVDTSWSTLFVPSVNCTKNPQEHEVRYCKIHPLYNSSLSSTYRADLTPATVSYTGPGAIYTWGNVSRDSLHVAGIEIKGQAFEEAIKWHPDAAARDEVFDTALGLALFPARNGDGPGDFTSKSPFQNMMRQKLLYKNIFSLKFPRNDLEAGELTLGGLPPYLQKEEMVEVLLDHSKTDDSDHIWRYYTMNGWQIGVKSMSMSSNTSEAPNVVMGEAKIAVVASAFPYIGLPDDVTDRIHEAIGMRHSFDWIDCAKRLELPDWTITFGPDGQSITLTPWDYLIEFDSKFQGGRICITTFFGLEEMGDKGFIVLGAPFLNGLYTVFDAGRKSISFANRPL